MSNKSSHLNICIIGAGFSGLCAAIKLKEKLGINSYTIFDQNKDVGGTWFVNKYPGCLCDVNAHNYSLSFETNSDWPKSFSEGAVIWKYIKGIAEKHSLYSHIKFEHLVKTVVWDEMINKWRVSVVDNTKGDSGLQNLVFDIIINGTGGLRVPNYPEQFMSFKGPIIHSAEWDSSIDLDGKVIAVVGSGSSAVQIIPEVAKQAKDLHVYQRKPAWVVPQQQYEFPSIVKFIFAYIPLVLWVFRCFLYLKWERLYPALKTNSWMNKYFTKECIKFLEQEVKDEKLLKELTPNYTALCKRICVSDSYLSTFSKSNVTLYRSPIVNVSPDSILTKDGVKVKIDVIILATGFRSQDFFHPLQIIGRNGENIIKKWKEDKPLAYYGIICHEAPNHFMLLGPNTLLGNNSVVFMMECQVNFIVKLIEQMMKSKSSFVSVKAAAQNDYMTNLHEYMKTKVWYSGNCGAWYGNSKGDITMIYPYPSCWYWWTTRKVDFSKFDWS